jgi:hypothetical protein
MSGPRNVAASVRGRLLNKARAEKRDFNLLLTRYALERMLYRLSISRHRDNFVLKGSLLFDLWFDVPHRPTHDADLLGFTLAEVPDLIAVFREISEIESADGIAFRPETVRATEIRKEASYPGIRVTSVGLLDGAHCPIQIDVGFGDAIISGPEESAYPVVLAGMPQPHLRIYPQHTVIAEKLEAIVKLGMANTRMKDYFDLWVLARQTKVDFDVLTRAIHATFERRGTLIPAIPPLGLTDEFARDDAKARQWAAFQRKNGLNPLPLIEVIETLRQFLLPVLSGLVAANANRSG